MNNIIKMIKPVGQRLWRREVLYLLIATAVFLTIFISLSNIPSNAAQAELNSASDASSIGAIFENPVNAPYKILTLIATTLSPTIRAVRAVSFIYLMAAVYGLFYVLNYWHKSRPALLATAIFATNSLVLSVGRLGTPLITVFSWFIFSGLLLWQLHSKSNKLVPMLVILTLSALLYTPGALWFVLILGVVYWNKFRKLFRHVKRHAVLVSILLGLVIATPLILGFARDPFTFKTWLLLPQELDWSSAWRSALAVPSAFLYKMPVEPLLNVHRLPVFDIASGMLFLVGLNAYRQKLKLDRTKIMIGSALAGITIGALGQVVTAVVLLLPFTYGVIAAGIEFLLDEWNRVFPKNPFAQSFGVVIITVVVSFSAYYHLTRFLVVWPQVPEVRATYNQPRILE